MTLDETGLTLAEGDSIHGPGTLVGTKGIIGGRVNSLGNPTEKLQLRIQELEAALKGVLRVADRKTDEFDAAREALGEE